jgi:hypothetical protein
VLLLILTTGCHKKNDPNAMNPLSGCELSAAKTYDGAIGSDRQTVNVQADVIDHPYDQIAVTLCKMPTAPPESPKSFAAKLSSIRPRPARRRCQARTSRLGTAP